MADYADTPWWSNLLAVLLTFAVTLVGTVYAMKSNGGLPTVPSGPTGLIAFAKDTLVYMPHALLLYGVIADMLTYEGVYSIGSLVGLISLVVHVLFKFIWKGTFEVIDKVADALTKPAGTSAAAAASPRASKPTAIGPKSTAATAPERVVTVGGAKAGSFFGTYNGCDIQGFDWAHSPYSPQTLVVIATIFSYYGFDLIKNRGWGKAGATIGLGTVFFLVQLFLAGDCTLPDDPKPATSKWYQAILAAAEGLFTGGVSYTVVQAYFPQRLPSSAISPFPKTTPNMLKDGKFDKDGNPWVCVGGVCYPDMSTADARKKFADIAAESTGNGRSAVSEDCPAN
jgi:hypothetical protein